MNSYNLATNAWWPPDQQAADDYISYAQDFNLATCLSHFDQVSSSARSLALGGGSGASISTFLRDRISNQLPTSLIRLGDADGNVLFSALNRYPELTNYNLQKISSIYFGNKDIMPRNIEFFFETVVDGIENADLIGGPERGTIESSFSTPFPDLDVRGMCGMRGVYNYLATQFDLRKLSNSIWASTWFSRALLPHYVNLLRNQKFLGFITCYPELELLFCRRANVLLSETLLVPMQASIARTNRDICHYPEVFHDVLNRIHPPFQGAVYIVAAGILSKPYCTRIKRLGGIAIDVGSVADIWMGKVSRPNMPRDMAEKWKLE